MKTNYCTLYVVRHGETDWNVAKKIQGHTDIDLNTEGEKQAQLLGEELKDIDFEAVFSSDLIRAKRTAEIIALEKKLAVTTTELLRERKFGRFEGKHIDAFKEMGDVLDKLTDEERFSSKHFPDVENDEELINHFITFTREVCVANPGKNILITTHGGILRSLLVHLGYANYKDPLHVGNTAYMVLKSDGVDFFIEGVKGIEKNITT
ncbi:MAG: histidine phosphatase family protein [Microgenomates group bacterium]|jgi:broad specificity phosphatase PhoE